MRALGPVIDFVSGRTDMTSFLSFESLVAQSRETSMHAKHISPVSGNGIHLHVGIPKAGATDEHKRDFLVSILMMKKHQVKLKQI